MAHIVGIDLGTTNSLVAAFTGGRPEIIPNRLGKRLTPSIVGLNADERLVVGDAARAQFVAAPDRTVAEVKRMMGTDRRVKLGSRVYTPQEISALVLKSLKEDAEAWFGGPVDEAVITVPAYFTDAQRQATKDAGELAGFKVERILNEPTAAALAYGLDHLDAEQLVLVYDLGGGTLDVSVLEMFQGVLDVKASAGNNALGGSDFDAAIVTWATDLFEAKYGVSVRGDASAMVRLKAAAEHAKIELTTREATVVTLPALATKGGVLLHFEEQLTRANFESLIGALARSTLAPVEAALRDAKVDRKSIAEIVIVGGASRVPLIHKLVTEFFGRAPREGVHPDEAIALGAAVQAGLKSGSISSASGIMITDVCPFTLGVAVQGGGGMGHMQGLFSPIIARNSTVPVSRSESYTTAHDEQTKVDIEVYQGESRLVRYNTPLGTLTVEGVPPGKAGQERVIVTFTYDINGILNVRTRIASTGKEVSLKIDRSASRLSDSDRVTATARLDQEWNAPPPATSAVPTASRPGPSVELLVAARARLPALPADQRARLERLIEKLDDAGRMQSTTDISRADAELTNYLFELS